jgi:hypothetical protein
MGLAFGLFSLGVGIAFMGYYIGRGLQNFSRPDKGNNYNLLIKESDLKYYLNLNQSEVEELIQNYPNVPNIELKGKKYYPYNQLMEWSSSIDNHKK